MGALKIDVIGGKENFWLHSEFTGFDLTHPPNPTSTPVYPRISLNTTTERVAIDPSKTALVVVDLQNYFLSTSLGRPSDAAGLKVVDRLLKHAIPACRKAGIPVVWLNWGLTQQDIEGMPPTIVRGFAADNNFSGRRKIEGLGAEVGPVELDDGSVVDGGKVLMLGQWNSASPLEKVRKHQDISINKNRLSGFWGGTTAIEEALTSRGIRTLLFAGCNTDQCVGGSLQDAFTRDWDCLSAERWMCDDKPEVCRRLYRVQYRRRLGFRTYVQGPGRRCRQFADITRYHGLKANKRRDVTMLTSAWF